MGGREKGQIAEGLKLISESLSTLGFKYILPVLGSRFVRIIKKECANLFDHILPSNCVIGINDLLVSCSGQS